MCLISLVKSMRKVGNTVLPFAVIVLTFGQLAQLVLHVLNFVPVQNTYQNVRRLASHGQNGTMEVYWQAPSSWL